MAHKNFLWGKGVFIWKLQDCLNGDIDALVTQCHTYDISYLVIKGGDGNTLYPTTEPQLTRDVVNRLQQAGIKVYSWSAIYGNDPVAEAEVAKSCLSLGVSGHVFDAEGAYEELENNTTAAQTMLTAVRAAYPDTFLAYSTFSYIDLHLKFPYVTFGTYCDAVMPQVYYGNWGKTPQQGILAMYDNFFRWQKNWTENGHEGAVKPIVPVGQAFDNYQINPPYVLKPVDITSFVTTIKAYKSVAFVSFEQIVRLESWEAIKTAQLDTPTDEERGVATSSQDAVQNVPETTNTTSQTVHTDTTTTTVIEEVLPQTDGTTPVTTTIINQTITPATASTPIGTVAIPKDKPTTIVLKPNDAHPDGFEMKVYHHKTHRELVTEFLKQVAAQLKIHLPRRKNI